MRVKQSRANSRKIAPAPLSQRRRSKRWTSRGSRGAPPTLVRAGAGNGIRMEPAQWLAFISIGLTALALIALIWTLTERAIDEQGAELRARADQTVKSVSFVLAREIQNELLMVDQTLAIIQDAWNKDSDTVDLGKWRKQALALTQVANDIFIANEQGIIVQGTLPQSIGQGVGSAYVTYPNGSLEVFDPDGTKTPDGKIPGADRIEARQFLTYLTRPLARPERWFVGASYRAEGITKLFAGARLGQDGVVGLVAVRRGSVQAIVGSSAQFANMEKLSDSDLIEQIRKNEAGVWAGVSPIDGVRRIIGFQRVPGRDMSVMVGVTVDTATAPLPGLAAMSRGLAAVGSLVVLTIACILVWTVATMRAAKLRERILARTELNLVNVRQELGVARARALLSASEAGALMSSTADGVARVDNEQRLRHWNSRFAELAGVPLDESALGTPMEDLLRRQANAGLFGEAADAEQAIATRLTILHVSTQFMAPPEQRGPGGEQLAMLVRGVADGGYIILLTAAENTRFAAPPEPVAPASEPEHATADETMEL